jgi:5-formyltetrahydrofolate cyclo-ligase
MISTCVVERDKRIPASHIDDAKQRLRRCLMARRAALSPDDRYRLSAAMTIYVCSMPAFQTSHTVMVYMALPDEVQTTELIAAAQRQNKCVVVPVVTSKGLVAVAYPSDARHFRRGPYGILEPCDTSAVVDPTAIDWVLVPGVGFDPHGMRLGYGKGYYDRFLPQLAPRTQYGGVAYHTQIVPSVPHMPHDIRMQFLITEQGILRPCEPPHVINRAGHGRPSSDKGEHR